MIPYGRHDIDEHDIDAVSSALNSDWLTTGPLVEEFEEAIAKLVGAPTVSVSSGTAALHSAYSALGIEPGDEIITPPITFIATQATAAILGASIVFADVEEIYPNIDPIMVERAITAKTKAIVAVDYGGQPGKLNELRALANSYGIFLIEDAAHSIGSLYMGQQVGSIADLTTFSFFPTKNMTTGEGGAIAGKDPELLSKVRHFARQGLVRDRQKFLLDEPGGWHQEVHEFGLNYRLPDILCALGISQLAKLGSFKLRRQEIFNYYQSELIDLNWISLPAESPHTSTNWHLFPIKVDSSARRSLYEYLRSEGVGVQVNYLPAYRHPVFKSYNINPRDFPRSEEFYSSELSLPIHPRLTNSELEYICFKIKNFKL